MKKALFPLLALLLLACPGADAQNLVPNPGFDTLSQNTCGFISSQAMFNQAMTHWYDPSDGTPDILQTNNPDSCWNHQPSNTYSGPICKKGSQLPRSNESMVGLNTYTIAGLEQRDYVQVELTDSLYPGTSYELEFYVSLADLHEYGSDGLGAWFTPTAQYMMGNGVMGGTPQFEVANPVMDTAEWVRIADTLTFAQAVKFLTIGNFRADSLTSVQANPGSSTAPGCYGAYYFLDDLSVRAIETATASPDISFLQEIEVGPNPFQHSIRLRTPLPLQSIQIFDLQGKNWPVEARRNALEQDISLTQLPKGMYVLVLELMDGQVAHRKIIKQ